MEQATPTNPFAEWIRSYGPARLAGQLGVDRTVPYKWINGDCRPGMDNCVEILKLAPHLTLSNLMHLGSAK